MNGITDTELRAGSNDDGRRLDRILRKALPELPLSGIHRLLRQKRALVDGLPAQADARVRSGQMIRLRGFARDGGKVPQDGIRAVPAKKPLRIIWEGAGLLALDKEAGVQVHGPDSLDEQARAYFEGKLPASLSFRPGPLHRLDRPASGIVVFSSSLEGARIFSGLLRARLLKKRYLALVDGKLEEPALWEETLVRDTRRKKTEVAAARVSGGQGKTAITRALPLAAGDAYSLVLLEIETGRHHQIRSQAAFHGHPLAGDRKYGGSFLEGGLLLHALSLEFPQKPDDAGEEGAWDGAGWDALWGKRLCAALPGAFLAQIERIFGKKIPKFIVT